MNTHHKALLGSSLLLLLAGCSKGQGAGDVDTNSVSCKTPLSEDDITLDPDEVHPIVEANFQPLGHCYERARASNPSLQGRIEVNLVIEPDGSPSQVCSGESSLPSDAVISCVLRTFAQFQFPEQDAQVATIYPVDFSPY